MGQDVPAHLENKNNEGTLPIDSFNNIMLSFPRENFHFLRR